MSGFTPGPWEIDGAQVCIHGGCALADVHGADERAEANVRLIARAPDMYELIRDALDGDDFRERAEILIAHIDGKKTP
jgi:hypothetical protein